MQIEIRNLEALQTAAGEFVRRTGGRGVFAFYGEMGAGKTTFIRAVCRELGVTESVTSPTFAIVNEYGTDDGATVYHFDFYRVRGTEELFDLGCEEYFCSGHPCFIEWPGVAEPVLPEETVRLRIRETEEGGRIMEFI
ncbi:MAG: tRNA (adenosine(37)-N6)-threonylcarbamoyltransferase complex ATPase subunit type 1 TsaE [Proteiniphilum sp.]|jgi:tRNA threonylcarbamoyladenosine biosynthesis protein TsaE|nr:tRNA (adenosine(37)-N6)-threonylcarbamoyltransferase complex ATPase subunit type 1 TsaE [Proteiniphilum sp.]